MPPRDLGATVKAALERAAVGREVGHVAVGHVIIPSRATCIVARGRHQRRHRQGNPGLQRQPPVRLGPRPIGLAQTIMLGDAEIAVGAGARARARAALAPAQRWGARMGDSVMLDMMTGALSDPFGRMHMGVTAENVAEVRHQPPGPGCTGRRIAPPRGRRDRGRPFRDQIVPVTLKSRKGDIVFDTDEHVRRDVTADSLAA